MINKIKIRIETFFLFIVMAFVGLFSPKTTRKLLIHSVTEYLKERESK